MKVNIELTSYIRAPIDLVWELLLESAYEKELCPVSGLQGGEILEEYEDGLLRKVLFNGRVLEQRVMVKDETYTLKAAFTGKDESGFITNQLKQDGIDYSHASTVEMDIHVSWESKDIDEYQKIELQSLLGMRTTEFKAQVENMWAENDE